MKLPLLAFVGLLGLISAIPHFGAVQNNKAAVGKLAADPIGLEPVVTGLSLPVFLTHAGDGTNRLFIIEQAGIIKVLQPGGTIPTVFLNITAKVLAGGERGLLGLAFHPNYETNRRFFVYYTRKPDGTIVIAEYLVSSSNPNVAETNEVVLLTVTHPATNHNGGTIEFGPDGFLYIGLGDGGINPGPSNPAQNRDDLLGKILRIDIDVPNPPALYSSPPTNPFFGPGIPGRDEVYALGLRNPWRFSFDSITGEIIAGDVGWTEREELDLITLGGNYGWSIYEGTLCTNTQPTLCIPGNYIPPIIEYSHTGDRCAIMGGYVYRGSRSSLPVGSYVYGDDCTGEIFLLEQGGVASTLLDSSLIISSFGRDESGEIYALDLSGGIYRIYNTLNAAALEIQTSQTNYVNGQIVTASQFRLKNPGTAAANVELKVWLKMPAMEPISVLNLGADGSLMIPAGTNQNLGPLTLFTVDATFPRGNYEFSSRMIHPVTGKHVSTDLNIFTLQ
jgi:glucose/arabinose dehydrogenase